MLDEDINVMFSGFHSNAIVMSGDGLFLRTQYCKNPGKRVQCQQLGKRFGENITSVAR